MIEDLIGHPEETGHDDCVRTRWWVTSHGQRANGNRANVADTAGQLESARASTASKLVAGIKGGCPTPLGEGRGIDTHLPYGVRARKTGTAVRR